MRVLAEAAIVAVVAVVAIDKWMTRCAAARKMGSVINNESRFDVMGLTEWPG